MLGFNEYQVQSRSGWIQRTPTITCRGDEGAHAFVQVIMCRYPSSLVHTKLESTGTDAHLFIPLLFSKYGT